MKKVGTALEKWGYYLLAALCAAVILFSALWTKQLRAREAAHAPVLLDESQHLKDVAPSPLPISTCAPAGDFLRGYSEAPVYFAQPGLWQCHPGVDFALDSGMAVTAVRAGEARLGENCLTVTDGDEAVRYRGCAEYAVTDGQRVRAGDVLGYAGANVPYEGSGHICLTWLRHGVPYDPGIGE